MSDNEKTWLSSEYSKEIKRLRKEYDRARGLAKKTVYRQLMTAKRELKSILRQSIQLDVYYKLV